MELQSKPATLNTFGQAIPEISKWTSKRLSCQLRNERMLSKEPRMMKNEVRTHIDDAVNDMTCKGYTLFGEDLLCQGDTSMMAKEFILDQPWDDAQIDWTSPKSRRIADAVWTAKKKQKKLEN